MEVNVLTAVSTQIVKGARQISGVAGAELIMIHALEGTVL